MCRTPPVWDTASQAHYSFRAWHTDLSQWIILTDLQPSQQASAIAMRLSGTSRELARNMTPDEMTYGGTINGVPVDPVSYLVHHLCARFAQFDDESRMAAMTHLRAVQ